MMLKEFNLVVIYRFIAYYYKYLHVYYNILKNTVTNKITRVLKLNNVYKYVVERKT